MTVYVAQGKSITHRLGRNGMLKEGDCADCLDTKRQNELLDQGYLTKENPAKAKKEAAVKAAKAAAKKEAAIKSANDAAKKEAAIKSANDADAKKQAAIKTANDAATKKANEEG